MRRVSVVGTSGSGKTTVARRLAGRLGVPHVELDALFHGPGWQPADADAFLAAVDDATSGEGWVVDGNYRAVVGEGPVWARADTVVWLDLPRAVVMRQVVRRTLRRALRREELWNGNREPVLGLVRWDPGRSIVRWAWSTHAERRQQLEGAMGSPTCAHLMFVRLRSRAEIGAFLAGVEADRTTTGE